MMRHIVFVTGNYPSWRYPAQGVFVKQLVEAMVAAGTRCTVIHPWKLHDWAREVWVPQARRSHNGASVVRPLTLSLSNRRVGRANTFWLTHRQFRRAVWRGFTRLDTRPDALYGHFLYSAGEAAVWAGRKTGIPSFVAVGEGNFWTVRPVGIKRAQRDFRFVAGVLAVSKPLKCRLQNELNIPADKISVFPNGVDLHRFFARSRAAMRKKYGFSDNVFVVIYVGNFIEPKGVQRVATAIDGMDGVAGVFVGSGPLQPQGSNILFRGRVPHEQVPELLSAADCFVLPSDVEGSSNATLEAMACGLPVIVSNGEYNDDIVSDEVAIRVPHHDIRAIRLGIQRLRDDAAFCSQMGDSAEEHAKEFDIERRASAILNWMEANRFTGSAIHNGGSGIS